LDTATAPLSAEQIASELAAIGGKSFTATARSGRQVKATHVAGCDIPIMISGGQHANETTGVVGALRAAKFLAKRPVAHFTIATLGEVRALRAAKFRTKRPGAHSPLAPSENAEGYALHQRLRQDNPRHMSHAARYTALGDDLEYRSAENAGPYLFEKAIRTAAQAMTSARLHVNLHGYPS